MTEQYAEGFASAYDQHWSPYPTRVARELLAWHEQVAPDAPRRMLDIGCGTGLVTRQFQDAGYDVTGLDISTAMLAQARERLGDAAVLVHGDASDFTVEKPVPLAVSTYDIPNHLRDPEKVEGYLRSAHAAVEPGGFLVFDVATLKGLEGMNTIQVRETEDSMLVFRGALDEAAGVGMYRISGVVRAEDGRYDRFATTITNGLVPMDQLRSQLQESGWQLQHIAATTDIGTPLAGLPEDQVRVVVVARRD